MSNNNIADEIVALRAKFPELQEKELKKVLHDVWKPKHSRKEDRDAIAGKMKEIVGSFDKMSLAVMKRALVDAWNEQHPDGKTKSTRQPSEWHKFMRENKDRVQKEHPNTSQHERIKILGTWYKERQQISNADAAVPVPVPAVAAAPQKKKK
jgi:hypothetical protein